ncbi:MAG: hypothetical protein ACFB50_18805 [Rubrobacteraceae bacterium]
MNDRPRRPRAKVRVSSINVVIPGDDESSRDHPSSISIVQQNSMIVNRATPRQARQEDQDVAEEEDTEPGHDEESDQS